MKKRMEHMIFKNKIADLGKKSSSSFNYYKRINTSTISRNFDNFPSGTFYSNPLQLGTKEYVKKCT